MTTSVLDRDPAIAFMADGQVPLDGEAVMAIASAAEDASRFLKASEPDPSVWRCPVRFENKYGDPIKTITPSAAARLADYLKHSQELSLNLPDVDQTQRFKRILSRPGTINFVDASIEWLRDTAKNARPIIVGIIDFGRIAIKPDWARIHDPYKDSSKDVHGVLAAPKEASVTEIKDWLSRS